MRHSGRHPSTSDSTLNATTEPLSDEEWARRIRDGSYAAFTQLFHTYYEDLVRFALGYVKTSEVAEGLIQDIFFNIWRSRGSWHPRGTLNAYLFGAARNNSLNYLRRRGALYRIKNELSRWTVHAADSPDAVLEFEEFSQALHQAVQELPARRREVFELSREQGLTYAEIAAVMGISVNTVENQMVKAMKFLRARLSPFFTLGGSLILLGEHFLV